MDMDRPGPWKRKKGNSTWIQSSLLKILRSNGPGLDMELTIVKLLVFILRIQNEQIHHLVLNHDLVKLLPLFKLIHFVFLWSS